MPSGPQVFKWRTPTKIVAIVDLVLSTLSIIYLILGLIGVLILTDAAVDEFQKHPDYNKQQKDSADTTRRVAMIVTVVVFGIALLLVVVDIVAAVRLLAASMEGVAPTEAISKAKCWRILNIIFVIFCILGIFGGGDNSQRGASLFNAILRGVGVAIATLYKKELEVAATNPQVYYDVGQA